MGNITFNPALAAEERAELSQASRDALSRAAERSKNPTIVVTSLRRSAERQAQAMYNNLANGRTIRYAIPGQQVCEVYRLTKIGNAPADVVIAAMTRKIEELQAKGQLVSRHCVSAQQYARCNVVDISTALPNPRDFVVELCKDIYVARIITPIAKIGGYGDTRVSVDGAETAIHVEIEQ